MRTLFRGRTFIQDTKTRITFLSRKMQPSEADLILILIIILAAIILVLRSTFQRDFIWGVGQIGNEVQEDINIQPNETGRRPTEHTSNYEPPAQTYNLPETHQPVEVDYCPYSVQEEGWPDQQDRNNTYSPQQMGAKLRRSNQMLEEERSRRRNDSENHRKEREQLKKNKEEEIEKLKTSCKKLQQKNNKLQRKIKKLQQENQKSQQKADTFKNTSKSGKDSLSQIPRHPERVPESPNPNVQQKSPGKRKGKQPKNPRPFPETLETNWPSLPGPSLDKPSKPPEVKVKCQELEIPDMDLKRPTKAAGKMNGKQPTSKIVGQERLTNPTTQPLIGEIEDPLPTQLEITGDSGPSPKQEGSEDNNADTSNDEDQTEDEAGPTNVAVAPAEPADTDNEKDDSAVESDTSEEVLQ